MVLQSPDFLNGVELAMDGSWLNKDTLREMFEFRLMLEIGLADFLFNNKKKRLVKKLERIISREEKASNEAERMKADADFHAALYEATGNKSLIRFQEMLYPLFIQYASGRIKAEIKPVLSHKLLLEELKEGTADSFRFAMRQHLDPHFMIQATDSK